MSPPQDYRHKGPSAHVKGRPQRIMPILLSPDRATIQQRIIDAKLKATAVELAVEHRAEYPSQVEVGKESLRR